MSLPGVPKFGPVLIGHEGTHGGQSFHHKAVLDDYPIQFALRAHDKPASSMPPPKATVGGPRRKKYYGEAR